MIFRNTFLAKGGMALGTNKRRILLLLIDLEIQSPAVIGGGRDVTSVWPAARTHGDLQGLRIQGVHRRDVMTTHAVEVWMLSSFMPERASGNPAAPFAEHRRIRYPHGTRQLRIEIDFQRLWWCQLMTDVAVGRRGRNSGIGAVAGETHRMTVWRRLESALL